MPGRYSLIVIVVGWATLWSVRPGLAADDLAVPRALKWLAAQQRSDGSWSFDCPTGGDEESAGRGIFKYARNGATGLTLLAFLSVGQTHTDGRYRNTVNRGLEYLLRNMQVRGDRGSLEDFDGRLYSHAWATLALCEGYAMTRDERLQRPAQLALNHIIHRQDGRTGGWRYRPGRPCNIALAGWMVKAMQSGHMAYLEVPPEAVKRISKFLDSVQSDGGASYGHTKPGANPEATAIGLLCRCCLGWKRDHPALRRGFDALLEREPRPSQLNESYFLMLLVRLAAPNEANRDWRSEIRETLIAMQSDSDALDGSWYLPDGEPATKWGGRLYCTTVSTLIMSVRFQVRIWPGPEDDDFPL
jgi:hypothetical protein